MHLNLCAMLYSLDLHLEQKPDAITQFLEISSLTPPPRSSVPTFRGVCKTCSSPGAVLKSKKTLRSGIYWNIRAASIT